MDEQSLIRFAAFIDNKVKELEGKLTTLQKSSDQIGVASGATLNAAESLNDIKEEIKNLKTSIKQDMQLYLNATRNRPIIGGWQIAGIVSVILLALNFGVQIYDRINQESIVEKRVASQTEMLESRLKSEMNEKAKWANSLDGKIAYEFSNLTDIKLLSQCTGKGWKIKNGFCFPDADEKNNITGWRISK